MLCAHRRKLDKIGARLEHTSQKSLTCFAQENGISISSVAIVAKLLKLEVYKVTIVHTLQPHDLAAGLIL
jgi:hypothetical protein